MIRGLELCISFTPFKIKDIIKYSASLCSVNPSSELGNLAGVRGTSELVAGWAEMHVAWGSRGP